MYKIIILSAVVALSGYAALKSSAFHSGSAEAPEKKVPASKPLVQGNWQLLTETSEIQWKASYVAGGGHQGTLSFKEGRLRTGNLSLLTEGMFVIDMNTIHNTDVKEADGSKSLDEHLKSEDFFATSKFPFAYFSVTGSSIYVPAQVSGKLAIKNVVRPLDMPFVWRVQNDTLYVQAQVKIDRTQFGINYESEGIVGAIKNSGISNTVELVLQLRFKRMNNNKDNC